MEKEINFQNVNVKAKNPFFSASLTYLVIMVLFVLVRIGAYFEVFNFSFGISASVVSFEISY